MANRRREQNGMMNRAGHAARILATPTAGEDGYVLAWSQADGDFVLTPAGGGGGAPTDAQYLVLALNGTLTAERRFDPGIGLVAVDGGGGADYDLRFGFAGEANGDIPTRSGGAWGRLAVGSAGQVLTVSGGLPAWAAVTKTGRVGWWPRAGLSLGSTYEADAGFVQLARRVTFPIARAIGAADSEYGWTWLNRAALSSADENTTTANACRLAHGATSTTWTAGTAVARGVPLWLRVGQAVRIIGRIASNCDGNTEMAALAVWESGASTTRWALCGTNYSSGTLKAYGGHDGANATVALTAGERDAGPWYAIEIHRGADALSFRFSYSTAGGLTPPAPSAMTTLYSGNRTARPLATYYFGLMLQSGNTSGTATMDVLYLDVDDPTAIPGEVRPFDTARPWPATQYDATGATQWCGYVDLGSDAPAIDLAALRLDLAGRVNLRQADTATVQWSLVRDAAAASPGAGAWAAAAALAESGAGRYLHLYCRITSDGDTQGSIQWGDSGPAVRAA